MCSPDSSINTTDSHDMTEILLKAVLNIIALTISVNIPKIYRNLSIQDSKTCIQEITKTNLTSPQIFAQFMLFNRGVSWSWTYGSLVYNYICNQCLSPLTSWVRISLKRSVLDTTLCDKVCRWLATGRWYFPGSPVSTTNKTDRHDIAEILLKVALNIITSLCA